MAKSTERTVCDLIATFGDPEFSDLIAEGLLHHEGCDIPGIITWYHKRHRESLATELIAAKKREETLARALGYQWGYDLTANDGSVILQAPNGADLGRFENIEAALAEIAGAEERRGV